MFDCFCNLSRHTSRFRWGGPAFHYTCIHDTRGQNRPKGWSCPVDVALAVPEERKIKSKSKSDAGSQTRVRVLATRSSRLFTELLALWQTPPPLHGELRVAEGAPPHCSVSALWLSLRQATAAVTDLRAHTNTSVNQVVASGWASSPAQVKPPSVFFFHEVSVCSTLAPSAGWTDFSPVCSSTCFLFSLTYEIKCEQFFFFFKSSVSSEKNKSPLWVCDVKGQWVRGQWKVSESSGFLGARSSEPSAVWFISC